MRLAFSKMNGAGNDFILLDNRNGNVRLSPEQVARLCHRHRGVGADGVLLLAPCVSGRADWAWEFYNSDGSAAEMCGNGARCFARYIQRTVGAGRQTNFETKAGVIGAQFLGDQVAVDLTEPTDLRLNQPLPLSSGPASVHFLNTGVPHAVVFVPDAGQARVQTLGAEIRWRPEFAPQGANVNFVQRLGPDRIRVRTFERGVEGETLACGTGVTASAIVAAMLDQRSGPVQVEVQGGDTLEVSFRIEQDRILDARLTGPAEFVFDGVIEL